MDSQIKYKLEEMAFFLDEMAKSFQDDDRFKFMYSAFLSAGQSTLYYLVTRYENNPGFKDWYFGKKPSKGKMGAGGRIDKPEIKHLMNARGHIIHIESIKQGATREISYGMNSGCDGSNASKEQVDAISPAECKNASGPITVCRWLTDENLYMCYKNKRGDVIDDTRHISTLQHLYSAEPIGPKSIDILKLSKAELAEVKKLIEECEKRFP
jgi:hypothetical protein